MNSNAIDNALQQLHNTYTDNDGLQPSGYGKCDVGNTIGRFKAAVKLFVQFYKLQ